MHLDEGTQSFHVFAHGGGGWWRKAQWARPDGDLPPFLVIFGRTLADAADVQIAVLFAKAQFPTTGFLTDDITPSSSVTGPAAHLHQFDHKALASVRLSRTGETGEENTVKPCLLRGGLGCGAALRHLAGREHSRDFPALPADGGAQLCPRS